METLEHRTSNELAEDRTMLAIKRSLMAADRTLMAWLRTALSMISFGFTIYKVLQGLHHDEAPMVAEQLNPRLVGEFLVAMGTISMLMGTIEYWFTFRDLQNGSMSRIWRRPSFIMAMFISIAGLSVFVSIAAQLV